MIMKNKKWLFIVIAAVAILLVFTGYKNANKEIHQPKEEYFDLKNWAETEKDLLFRVEGYNFIEDEEIRNMEGLPDSAMFRVPMMVLCLKIQVKNNCQENIQVNLTKYILESDGWYNSIDQDFNHVLNPENYQLLFTLGPGEMKEMYLPYLLLESHFRKSEWEQIENREFWLTFELYPEKKMGIFQSDTPLKAAGVFDSLHYC